MSDPVLYGLSRSVYTRIARLALEEKGVRYTLEEVEIFDSAGAPAEHRARQPFGRIPAFEHDGFMLYETQAILRYLDRALPQAPLTPSDAKRAARMDQAMNVNDWYLFNGVGNVIIFHRVIGPRVLGLAPDEEAIKAAMPKAQAVFNELARLLGAQPYFAGEELSLADLMLAPQIEFFTIIPEWSVLGTPHDNLVSWMKRMQDRPSMKATTWERVSELAKEHVKAA